MTKPVESNEIEQAREEFQQALVVNLSIEKYKNTIRWSQVLYFIFLMCVIMSQEISTAVRFGAIIVGCLTMAVVILFSGGRITALENQIFDAHARFTQAVLANQGYTDISIDSYDENDGYSMCWFTVHGCINVAFSTKTSEFYVTLDGIEYTNPQLSRVLQRIATHIDQDSK